MATYKTDNASYELAPVYTGRNVILTTRVKDGSICRLDYRVRASMQLSSAHLQSKIPSKL